MQAVVPVFVLHDGVMIWKHFPHYWTFVREIQRNIDFSLLKARISYWKIFDLPEIWDRIKVVVYSC